MIKVMEISAVHDSDFSEALDQMVGAGRDVFGGVNLQNYIRELRER
jgi:hypothetical protein